MSSYKGYTHIQSQYIIGKIIVGAIKDNNIYVFMCDTPNCETEWEEICYCIDKGRLIDRSEIK